MVKEEIGHVILAPGGFIPNIPENRELLEHIDATQSLNPQQLLDLATFYQTYETNAILAQHLALVAETNLICDWLPDPIEDKVCGYDVTEEENTEKLNSKALFRVYRGESYKGQNHSHIAVARAGYEIKCISSLFPGLNLLIEKNRDGLGPYVIGVCPELKPQMSTYPII